MERGGQQRAVERPERRRQPQFHAARRDTCQQITDRLHPARRDRHRRAVIARPLRRGERLRREVIGEQGRLAHPVEPASLDRDDDPRRRLPRKRALSSGVLVGSAQNATRGQSRGSQ